MKKCPYCAEEIQDEAMKCKHCGEMLNQKTDPFDTPERLKRNVFIRIIFSILWFIPVYLLTNMIVGAIVGTTAAGSQSGFQEGYSAGYTASAAFFEKYGLLVFLFQIVLTAVLSFMGILPGTGKFKRKKRT